MDYLFTNESAIMIYVGMLVVCFIVVSQIIKQGLMSSAMVFLCLVLAVAVFITLLYLGVIK